MVRDDAGSLTIGGSVGAGSVGVGVLQPDKTAINIKAVSIIATKMYSQLLIFTHAILGFIHW